METSIVHGHGQVEGQQLAAAGVTLGGRPCLCR